MFSKVAALFHISINNTGGFQFLHNLLTFDITSFSMLAILKMRNTFKGKACLHGLSKLAGFPGISHTHGVSSQPGVHGTFIICSTDLLDLITKISL